MNIQKAYSGLKKFYSDVSLWAKFILMCLFIVVIGVILFYLFGKNKTIINIVRSILGGFSRNVDKQQNAVLVNKKESDQKVNYDSLSTGKTIVNKLNSIDSALSQL